MNSSKSNSENPALVRLIIANVPCAICQRRYSSRDVRVLDRRDHLWALAVKCRICGTEAILFAVMNDKTTRPIRTDLTPNEWARFRHAPPINEDDVILLHDHLQAYTGDFSEIMDEPLPDD
ncbi:MAG: hypothetical protein HY070_08485 [Chloroflexi bacterium]|nr:hypothetical protein [Chloroflexota bacterium]MBI3741108.1 hypothetical protein [Chloroflexota bacterium]